MDPVTAVLMNLGVGLGSQALYDFIKGRLHAGADRDQLAAEVSVEFPSLTLENAEVVASTVIDLFAERGFIDVRGTVLKAKDAVWMRSAPGTRLSFGDGSVSSTDKTEIRAGKGAEIIATGGAEVRQNDDGSISFHV